LVKHQSSQIEMNAQFLKFLDSVENQRLNDTGQRGDLWPLILPHEEDPDAIRNMSAIPRCTNCTSWPAVR
jgi:hypothetical protein